MLYATYWPAGNPNFKINKNIRDKALTIILRSFTHFQLSCDNANIKILFLITDMQNNVTTIERIDCKIWVTNN